MVLYIGLVIMMGNAIWDLAGNRWSEPDGCKLSPKHG